MKALRLGAQVEAGGTRFALWSTCAKTIEVRLFADQQHALRSVSLAALGDGLFEGHLAGVSAGALYQWVIDGRETADPHARFLPFGVKGPAEVIAEARVPPLAHRPLHSLVIYELHLGTFTPEGTYAAAAEKLLTLKELGVNALELLPLSSFPGRRGWGYDGVAHFAPHPAYGRPEELCAFMHRAHALGFTVLLDVVYNHFGPDGCTLGACAAEYFARDAENPWGGALDYTQPHMRTYVLENAKMWFEHYGFDGLRLDATHAIHDPSPRHILSELSALAHAYPQPRLLIAEDDRNDPLLELDQGLDAQWADDFHHQLHVLLTGEQDGYYGSYSPKVEGLARIIDRGWLYEGQVYPAWGRARGKPARGLEPAQLIYCLQNHDQVGNRALGTRLPTVAPLEALEAATVLLLFLPSVPLLFMGQEWAASTPFLFFSDHGPRIGPQVSEGRRRELAKFAAFADPAAQARIPDPQAEATFLASKLRWTERDAEPHRRFWALTQSLLHLRREDPVLSARCQWAQLRAEAHQGLLVVTREATAGVRMLVANFTDKALTGIPADERGAEVLVATGGAERGRLPPWSAMVMAQRRSAIG